MCNEMNDTLDTTAFNEVLPDLSELPGIVGQLFYIHDITETSFKDAKKVPNFYRNGELVAIQYPLTFSWYLLIPPEIVVLLDQMGPPTGNNYNYSRITTLNIGAWPGFLLFILLENLALYLQNKPTLRLNDSITSLSHGLIQECGRLIFRGSESAAYIYIYNNWKLVELPWDSPWTWYTALLAVDFLYYWVHRASHEIHIFWAQHQVHHSSEEFNIAVGLRQSLLQGWCSFVFYLPMAFVVPPAHFITHQQFNLLYQVWIHTKTIKSLGPLEYVLNTPRHHRVHHGCNIKCLDKNYGGVLIIWDRLFKTFAEEKEEEAIVYGLVHHQPSFNPLFLQVFYNQNVIEKFRSMKGFKNKLNSIIKGPSWMPGSPWTGFEKDKPDIRTRETYDIDITLWNKLYVSIHFVAIFAAFQHLAVIYMSKSPFISLAYVAYIMLSLTTIGMILENHPKAAFYEMARCLIFLLYTFHYENVSETFTLFGLLQILFCSSAFFWSLQYLSVSKTQVK